MRKLRDSTVAKKMLWNSACSLHSPLDYYEDELYESELQDNICFQEHAISQLDEEIKKRKGRINQLVKLHFEFAKDRRSFIKNLFEQIRHDIQADCAKLIENYLGSRIDEKEENKKETMTELEYLQHVREGCEKRLLPRKVFNMSHIENSLIHAVNPNEINVNFEK
jgi:hypothetical protein